MTTKTLLLVPVTEESIRDLAAEKLATMTGLTLKRAAAPARKFKCAPLFISVLNQIKASEHSSI
jgi:hypothetical protein